MEFPRLRQMKGVLVSGEIKPEGSDPGDVRTAEREGDWWKQRVKGKLTLICEIPFLAPFPIWLPGYWQPGLYSPEKEKGEVVSGEAGQAQNLFSDRVWDSPENGHHITRVKPTRGKSSAHG